MNFKILNTIGTKFDNDAKNILSTLGTVDYKNLSQEELLRIIENYEVVVIGLGLLFHKYELDHAKNLKFIATATTGLDHIDVEYAEKKGIKVLSLRGEDNFLNTITGTAELAWMLLLELCRFSPWAFESVKNGEWNREKFQGHSLSGKTLGIVGLGRLGKMVATYGHAFGMNVIFTDPHDAQNLLPFAKKVSFDELIDKSDAISIHVHLTKETEGLFSKQIFNKMKPTAYLINTSRGKIVNEGDLIGALEKKQLAGYGTDVLANELEFDTKNKADRLIEYAKTHSNVIILPHIGGMTFESRIMTDIFMAEKLRKHLIP